MVGNRALRAEGVMGKKKDMTEAEWLASTDIKRMLEFLNGEAAARKFYGLTRPGWWFPDGPAGSRKLRLFAVACCRVVWWDRLRKEASRQAVEVAERYADGLATRKELLAAGTAANRAYDHSQHGATLAARSCAYANAAEAAGGAAFFSYGRQGYAMQAHLLRDIFGNPFRPVSVEPSWLTWHDAPVRKLAQAIYDERRFKDLPVLADALEDAGCGDAAILEHCRGPEPHARGCWVLDLILSKDR